MVSIVVLRACVLGIASRVEGMAIPTISIIGDSQPATDALAEFLDEGLAHAAVILALIEHRLGPSDAGDVQAAIAGHVSAALEHVKEARELMEAMAAAQAADDAPPEPVAA